MVLAPHVFFADIGPFGAYNDHYIRDVATYNAALGVALLVAYRRESWRAPILCCLALNSIRHGERPLGAVRSRSAGAPSARRRTR